MTKYSSHRHVNLASCNVFPVYIKQHRSGSIWKYLPYPDLPSKNQVLGRSHFYCLHYLAQRISQCLNWAAWVIGLQHNGAIRFCPSELVLNGLYTYMTSGCNLIRYHKLNGVLLIIIGGDWRLLGGRVRIWGIAQSRDNWSVGGNLISEAGKAPTVLEKFMVPTTYHVFSEMWGLNTLCTGSKHMDLFFLKFQMLQLCFHSLNSSVFYSCITDRLYTAFSFATQQYGARHVALLFAASKPLWNGMNAPCKCK